MDGLPLGNSGSHDTNANSPGASANDGGATIFGRMFRTESPTSSGSAIGKSEFLSSTLGGMENSMAALPSNANGLYSSI